MIQDKENWILIVSTVYTLKHYVIEESKAQWKERLLKWA